MEFVRSFARRLKPPPGAAPNSRRPPARASTQEPESSDSRLSGGSTRPARFRGDMIHNVTTVATDSMTARSEEHTSELQSLMRNSYAVFCLKKTKRINTK